MALTELRMVSRCVWKVSQKRLPTYLSVRMEPLRSHWTNFSGTLNSRVISKSRGNLYLFRIGQTQQAVYVEDILTFMTTLVIKITTLGEQVVFDSNLYCRYYSMFSKHNGCPAGGEILS